MFSTHQVKNVDTLDSLESKSFNNVKEEIDEMVDVRNESILGENTPNELYIKGSKYIIDQIIDEDHKVWSKEDLMTTWNSHSVETEGSNDFDIGNDSTVHILSKPEVKTELGEMKVEEVTEDNCDLTSLNFTHSVKVETSVNFNSHEESKYTKNQIIYENGKFWPKEDFSTSWNIYCIKMDRRDNFKSKTECTKDKKKDVRQLLSSIQMEPSPPKCAVSKNLDSVISKRKRHKCHLCAHTYSRYRLLRVHIESVHLKLKNHKCTLCDYSSSQKSDIKKHLKLVHLELKNHKCDLCDYGSSNKGSLQRHIESIHLKLKNHKCDLCDYSAALKGTLQQHMISIHLKLKNHKCDLCDYRSSEKGTLQRHMISIHLKLKNYKCDLCDYSSSQRGSLQQHMKSIHLKIKDHKCDFCDYCSSRKSSLRKHLKLIHYIP